MAYKDEYNPDDYLMERKVIDTMLDLEIGYRFKIVNLTSSELMQLAFKIRQFLHQTKQTHLYCVQLYKDSGTLHITRKGKKVYEITAPESVFVGETGTVRSDETQRSDV